MQGTAEIDEFMRGFEPSTENYRNYKRACKTVSAKLDAKPAEDPALEKRQEFYIRLLAQHDLLKKGLRIADLGGGSAWFIVVLAQMGLDATLVDDFWGGGHVEANVYRQQLSFLEGFEKLGVKIQSQDLISKPLQMPDESLDVVTCFHTLEHWHHSPKKLFAEIRRVLRPGGHVIFATPNVVNLRKRVYTVLGKSPFANLDEWYQHEVFRGHVREPSIADLHQLYQWNGFQVVATYGRNFIGQDSVALSFLPAPLRRSLAGTSVKLLQMVPSLCSDIHVVGIKK
jgi:SAM-dependent methyltransferase